jgi:hypothetical protein
MLASEYRIIEILFFGGTEGWIQCLLLLYHLSNSASHFALIILDSVLLSAWASLGCDPPICASPCSWDDSCMHHTQLSVEMGVWWTFCPDWPRTMIHPFSASWVARITGLSHRACQKHVFYICHFHDWHYDSLSCMTKHTWLWVWYLAYEICLSDGPVFSYWTPCMPQSSDTAPVPSCNAPCLCRLHQGSARKEMWNYFQEAETDRISIIYLKKTQDD